MLNINAKEFEKLKPFAKVIIERKYSTLLIVEGFLFEYMYEEEAYEQKEKEAII
jgi:hypothetical protein